MGGYTRKSLVDMMLTWPDACRHENRCRQAQPARARFTLDHRRATEEVAVQSSTCCRRPQGADRACCLPRLHDRGTYRYHASFCSGQTRAERSEEHTSELQSLMRTSYAVFCLQKIKAHSSI